MNFVSFEFAAFLAVVYVLHWSCRYAGTRKWLLSLTVLSTNDNAAIARAEFGDDLAVHSAAVSNGAPARTGCTTDRRLIRRYSSAANPTLYQLVNADHAGRMAVRSVN